MGKRIAFGRKALGLTQDQMAEKLGVTAQAVSKWENDQSCPDISMVPRLAELFGITTDALLGVERKVVHEAQVVKETEKSTEEGESSWELNIDSGRKGGIALAVWILLSGGMLLCSNMMHLGASLWDVLWPTALLVFGVFGLWPRFSFLRLGCALLGAHFALSNLNLPVFPLGRELLLPAVLLLLGLSLLAEALRKGKKKNFQLRHNGKNVTKNSYETGEDWFFCSTSFGEAERLILLPILREGNAEVSFGELRVDLSGCAEVANGCTIQVSCAFGELELLVPRGCLVEPAVQTSFASLDFRGAPAPDADRILRLEGSASFGEISIRYL